MTARQAVRPSGWWYLLVVVFLALGVGVAVSRGVDEAKRIKDEFHVIALDERGMVELSGGAEQTVWAVWRDGRSTDSLERPEAMVRIHAADDSTVPFEATAPNSRFTISTGDLSAIDLGRFTPPTDGTYRVEVAVPEGADAPDEAAVSRPGLLDAAGRVLRPLGAALLASIAWIVGLAVVRGRAKRRLRSAQQPGSPQQGPITFS